MHARIGLLTLAFSAAVIGGAVAVAQDFRVDTDVFVDDDTQAPVAETLTLFFQGTVYDFILNGSEEITVLDVSRGRIVLLDSERRRKTSLTTEQLIEFSAAIKEKIAQGEKRQAAFDPNFTTHFDDESRQLELTNGNLTYRATGTRPKIPDAVARFREFADWYARLNAIRPGNLPPFGRLELNEALAARQLVPEEIEREIVVDGRIGAKRLRARSRHNFVWALSGTDRKRVEKAGRLMAEFSHVPLGEYWALPHIAKK